MSLIPGACTSPSQSASDHHSKQGSADEHGDGDHAYDHILTKHIGDGRLVAALDSHVDDKVHGDDGTDDSTDHSSYGDVRQPCALMPVHNRINASLPRALKFDVQEGSGV